MTLAICDHEVRRAAAVKVATKVAKVKAAMTEAVIRLVARHCALKDKLGVKAKPTCSPPRPPAPPSCISPSIASPFISRVGTPPRSTKSKSGSPSWCAGSSVGPVSPGAASGTMSARARQPMHDRHRAQLTRIVGVGTCSEVAQKVGSVLRAARPRNFLKDPAAQS
jgi:hypothetical protein